MDKEPILTIDVTTYDAYTTEGSSATVVMIPFSATASGCFTGSTVADGVDTQYITPDSFSLSARYMLQGMDVSGSPCRLFIENNGSSMDDCHPRVITDSETLKYLETMPLSARVEGREGGVIVRIYPAE